MTLSRTIAAACLALLCAPAAAAAQLRPQPTAAECAGWAQDLAAGGTRASDAVTYGWPAACPDAGSALGSALVAARTQRDAAYLWPLAQQAAQVHDPAVAAAALQVADDGGASNRARAAAILVAVAQLGSGWDYPGVSGQALLTDPLPAQGVCGPGASVTPFAVENPIPADYARQVARVLDRITTQGGNPPLVRNLARCSRPAVGPDVPLQVDVSRVSLEYVCGNTFRIHNSTAEFLTFSYTVEGTGEAGDVPVQGHKRLTFTTDAPAAVTLLYDGRPIQTVSNGGQTCR